MATKTLAGATAKSKVVTNDNWQKEIIRFEHGTRKYAVPLEGHLVLRDLSIFEIKDKLNKLPGKYAYWKSLRVDVEIRLDEQKTEYDIWFAEKYTEVADSMIDVKPKPTETKIKNSVILDNLKEYRVWQDALREISGIQRKIDVLVKSYDMQSWTLRGVGALVQSELNNIEVHGKGNLADIKSKGAK